mgnify:CR=1 FL=1
MLTEKDLEEVQKKMDFVTNAGVTYLSFKNWQSNVRHTLDEFRYILLNPEIATDISKQRWPEDPSQPSTDRKSSWTGRACEEYAAFIVQHQLVKLAAELMKYQEQLDEFIHIIDPAISHAALAEEKKLDDLRIKEFEEAEAND